MKQFFFCITILVVAMACNNNNDNTDDDLNNTAPANLNYTVVKIYPHDTSSYTQGLIWHNQTLYEGTGREGFSKLRKIDLATGKSQQDVLLNATYFGEGITILDNKIYQLTWQNNKVLVYDVNSLQKIKEFQWNFEGWGITHNNKSLIISTGSNNLYFVSPVDFTVEKVVGVNDNNGPVGNLNELEFVNGFVYANIFQTHHIVKINPETGRVEAKMDLGNILAQNNVNYDPNHLDVLNGIAYDSTKNSFYITGKLWPALFEIKLN